MVDGCFLSSKANKITFIGNVTTLKEIPGTQLLVSLNQHYSRSGSLAIFDISQKRAKKIYGFEEILGGKLFELCYAVIYFFHFNCSSSLQFIIMISLSDWPRKCDL